MLRSVNADSDELFMFGMEINFPPECLMLELTYPIPHSQTHTLTQLTPDLETWPRCNH